MPTYYKYQNPSEIGAAPTLDWGSVINNVNDTLQKQEQQRYENREADKKLSNDILTKVNELNLTSDPNANALITNMAYEAKKNLFELKKKLESGQISRSDFNILNQNSSASVAQLNQFSKSYGADYDKYLKDVQEGKTSAYADFMQKWKGGFQNFKDKKLIHSPTDGRLYVAEIGEDGKVKEGPLGMVPISSLVEVKNFDDKKIDLLAETNRYAAQLKPFVELMRSKGIESREALDQMPGFQDFVNNTTEAIAKNEKGYASILTDTDGTYSIIGDGQSSGKNIGLKNNGAGEMVPIIDDSMKGRTRELVKQFLIAQTGIKEEGTKQFAPTQPRAAKAGTPPKYTPEVSEVSVLKDPNTKQVRGVSINVSGVVIPVSKGIEERVDSVAYDQGKLRMKLTKVAGTETNELTTGSEDTGGTVKVGEGKRDIKETTRFITTGKENAQFSLRIKQVPYPGKDRNFRSIKEAEDFFKSQYRQQGGTSNTPSSSNKSMYKIKGKQYTYDQLIGMGYSESDFKNYKI
jgi:hypothetical protein